MSFDQLASVIKTQIKEIYNEHISAQKKLSWIRRQLFTTLQYPETTENGAARIELITLLTSYKDQIYFENADAIRPQGKDQCLFNYHEAFDYLKEAFLLKSDEDFIQRGFPRTFVERLTPYHYQGPTLEQHKAHHVGMLKQIPALYRASNPSEPKEKLNRIKALASEIVLYTLDCHGKFKQDILAQCILISHIDELATKIKAQDPSYDCGYHRTEATFSPFSELAKQYGLTNQEMIAKGVCKAFMDKRIKVQYNTDKPHQSSNHEAPPLPHPSVLDTPNLFTPLRDALTDIASMPSNLTQVTGDKPQERPFKASH